MDPARLKSIRVFEQLSDEQLRTIAPFADETSVPEGEQLVREGDFSYELIGIEEGTAKVTRGGEEVAELGPGDFFGEIALLEEQRRTASVIARTPMRLVVMHRRDFQHMQEEMPRVAEQVRDAVRTRLQG